MHALNLWKACMYNWAHHDDALCPPSPVTSIPSLSQHVGGTLPNRHVRTRTCSVHRPVACTPLLCPLLAVMGRCMAAVMVPASTREHE